MERYLEEVLTMLGELYYDSRILKSDNEKLMAHTQQMTDECEKLRVENMRQQEELHELRELTRIPEPGAETG